MSSDQVPDGRVRRLFQASAFGAVVAAEGGVLLPNSSLRIPEEADEEAVREDVVRRAQWAVALATIRCVVPDDEGKLQAKVAAAAFESGDNGTPRGDAARSLWREKVRTGTRPAPGKLRIGLTDEDWFRELALWLIGPLTMRQPDRPVAFGLTAATLHLERGCGEAFEVYAG